MLFLNILFIKVSKKTYHDFFKQSNTTIFKVDKNKEYQHFRMIRIISEGSCDTDDWSNGSWKSSQE